MTGDTIYVTEEALNELKGALEGAGEEYKRELVRLTNLINEIKQEFQRRNNPYNTTGLVQAAESLSISPQDNEDTYVIYSTYSQAITQLDNYYKNSIALDVENGFIEADDINAGYTVVN